MKMLAALLMAAMLSSPAAVRAQGIAPAKQAQIDSLMALTGALNLGKQMSSAFMDQITGMLKTAKPDMPERGFVIVREEVNAVISENLADLQPLVAAVYDKHLTLEELRGLTAFYRSPLGQKVIREMPLVMQECMTAGQQWGASLGPKIQARIDARFKKEKID